MNEMLDRAAGVLLGTAVGDALGVPYEFARPPGPTELARMLGGGLGNFAPGEWSDDTSMAVGIALVTAEGADLTSADALDAVASNFLRWYADGPPDIGIQTREVLSRTTDRLASGETGPAHLMTVEAQVHALTHAHSAGNGALMRTACVALRYLGNRTQAALASRRVASLTHADPLAGDTCVLWSEAIRVAVLEGRIDVPSGVDLLPESRRTQWTDWLDAAIEGPPSSFVPNGFTVTALQAALAAVLSEADAGPDHFARSLYAAVRIGDDTDTVAAIAGGLLGARWGASAVPSEWRSAVHGWPGLTGEDLIELAIRSVTLPGDNTPATARA
jgi:ADP-ribosyl-[dinitrogen reductase] hydrolase